MKISTAMLTLAPLTLTVAAAAPGERRIAVTFAGGYETDPQDGGRPVALVAGALGIKPAVFRAAFSGVRPAHDRRPTPDEARRNKAVLLETLGPYGVTNDRLDEVSDHYRYRPERGERWPTRPARAMAVVVDGKIVRFEIVDPGEGYSSPPKVAVPGYPTAARVELRFDRAFGKNGSVRAIRIAPSKG